jgi:hypothetical protein
MAGSPGGEQPLEDVVITSGEHFHVLRVVVGPSGRPTGLNLTLDRYSSNLAMARLELRSLAALGVPIPAPSLPGRTGPTADQRPDPTADQPPDPAADPVEEPRHRADPSGRAARHRIDVPTRTSSVEPLPRSVPALPRRLGRKTLYEVPPGRPEAPLPAWVDRFKDQAFSTDVETVRKVIAALHRIS